jgi:phosphoglucomutase
METLTGFKYIAMLIRELEGKRKYIAGGEESYGYLIGDFVRDKDAVASCAIIAEMTAYAKEQGLSLYQMLVNIHREFGLYHEDLISLTKKGKKGAEEIANMMQSYRQDPPKAINGSKVVSVLDYSTGEKRDMHTGDIEAMEFPSSNVLQFITADGSKISARPSGTEPKIKFYFSVSQDIVGDYDEALQNLTARVTAIQKDMGLTA